MKDEKAFELEYNLVLPEGESFEDFKKEFIENIKEDSELGDILQPDTIQIKKDTKAGFDLGPYVTPVIIYLTVDFATDVLRDIAKDYAKDFIKDKIEKVAKKIRGRFGKKPLQERE